MDLRVVKRAEYPPHECALCRTSQGPFLLARMPEFRVGTAHGLKSEEGRFYLCIGRDVERGDGTVEYHPGCARAIGRLSGCAAPAEAQALRQNIAGQAERIIDLEHQLEKAVEEQMPVVPMNVLLDVLETH